jgi:hypothetical protein
MPNCVGGWTVLRLIRKSNLDEALDALAAIVPGPADQARQSAEALPLPLACMKGYGMSAPAPTTTAASAIAPRRLIGIGWCM